ncbi:uncharacterized protein TRUGW13939_01754 [Talaromyces rugulosus]|uniref:Uncharacterized protein n=1 Tax=Talaromyces rugulosus TaxID=121627 RepID=A0A7H8QLA5_TALRU|nr:uncharacterized protein TRUGW13939_01754 [Talaromyces rugulosus]QKX54666.1 hypothetical protein TRUGW13939_01754 [Talaromyces rugulosus]
MQAPLPVIVKRLASTPPEIVCEILNDLRIWDVLRLICYSDPRINNAVLLNRWYGEIFEQNIDLLLAMREVVQLYSDFGREMRWKLAPLDSPLALLTGTPSDIGRHLYRRNIAMSERLVSSSSATRGYPALPIQKDGENQYYIIINEYMKLKIALHLHGLSNRRFKFLPLYYDKSNPLPPESTDYTLDGIKRRWHTLRNSQRNLVEHRIRQVTRAADLFESNPDILKLASDPGQHQRKNIAHIIGGMRRIMQQMSDNSMIRGDSNSGGRYFFVYFPVVPFDASLRLLLKKLKARHERTQSRTEEDDSIKILLAGLSSIYTAPEKWQWSEDTEQPWKRRRDIAITHPERIPRVMYKSQPYNAQHNPYTSDLDFEQLKFVSGYTKFYRFLPNAQREEYTGNREASWDTHDDREVEWLEAFVKVYRSVYGD